jgi:hypothetical protein
MTFPRIKTFDSGRAPDGSEIAGQVLAPINREVIAEKLKQVGADALANDPAALKKRIADLERQAKASPAASAPVADAQLNQSFAAGFADGRERGWKDCADTARRYIAVLDNLLEQYGETVKSARAAIMSTPQFDGARPENPVRRVRDVAPQVKATVPAPARARQTNGHAPSSLSAPRQKILDQLAWLESMGLYPAPKETLAAVSRVSPTSGGYFNNLGALRSSGHIEYPQAGMVAFTSAGRAQANPANSDGRDVHEHWLDIVSAPQRAILAALIKRHPDTIGKDELAGQINVSPTSGGYFNNLGRLRTLGAIDYPAPGQVQLTRYVMP